MTKRRRSKSRETSCKRRASTASSEDTSDSDTSTSSGSDRNLTSISQCSLSPSEPSQAAGSRSASSAGADDEASSKPMILIQPGSIAHKATAFSRSQSTPHPILTCASIDVSGLSTPPTVPKTSHVETPVSSFASSRSALLKNVQNASYTATLPEHAELPRTHPESIESFPIFNSGNVSIQCNLVPPSRRWQLHSAILERHSSWFKKALQVPTRDSNCFHTWHFFLLEELDGCMRLVLQEFKPLLQGHDIQSHTKPEALQLDGMPTPPASISSSGSVSDTLNEDEQPRAAMIEIYNQILGSFYSIPLTIPTATLPITLSASETLVKIANSLSCIPLISTQISTALHHHRQTLYASISHDPARTLLLSISLQNEAIYTESLIHIIGAHPSWPWPTARAVLPPSILAIVTRKSSQLTILCTEISHQLLLATITVHNDRPVDAQNHSEFDTWFVVQIFRDTLVRTFNALDDSRRPSLQRGSLFRKIGRGGSAWLKIEEARRLMRKIMPSALESLEEDLEALKEYASGAVQEVARNRSLVDVEKEGVGWLTCVEIGRGDVFWRMGDESSVGR